MFCCCCFCFFGLGLGLGLGLLFLVVVFLLLFLLFRPHPRHMEVSRRGVKLELQLPAYTTDIATQDLSWVCCSCFFWTLKWKGTLVGPLWVMVMYLSGAEEHFGTRPDSPSTHYEDCVDRDQLGAWVAEEGPCCWVRGSCRAIICQGKRMQQYSPLTRREKRASYRVLIPSDRVAWEGWCTPAAKASKEYQCVRGCERKHHVWSPNIERPKIVQVYC